ncbi:pesticin C-terminus-like muramidase [Pseudomonas sp. RIT-To-2]|uniref:pesticin C-terminus-like muramidase n=1 Tax=Pseudomonas sp. RIT-To-2 TaxID=3462541 RepID=UPI002413C452
MTVTLPAEIVYAYGDASSGFNPNASVDMSQPSGPPPFHPNEMFIEQHIVRQLFANGVNVFTQTAKGLMKETMQAIFSGFNSLTTDQVKDQLQKHADANRLIIAFFKSSNASNLLYDETGTEVAYGHVFYGTTHVDTTIHDDFYGDVLMPVGGITYWLFGGGQDRYVNIASLNLQMGANDFSPVNDIILSAQPGTYTVNAPFNYENFNYKPYVYAAGLLGQVSGTVSGTVTIAADGSYSFSGSYTLNPDNYNANHASRPYMPKEQTDFIASLGDIYGHTDYRIVIEGSQSVTFTGNKSTTATPKAVNGNSTAPVNGVDYGFISTSEGGQKLNAYVPTASSGVTLGTGVDLHGRTQASMSALGWPQSLIDQLLPYTTVQGSAASTYLQSHPLSVSQANADIMDQSVLNAMISTVATNYNNASAIADFYQLPSGTQTAIFDLAYQYGTNLASATPNFWNQITSGQWQQALDNLNNFGDAYPTRRGREAQLLQADLNKYQMPSASAPY